MSRLNYWCIWTAIISGMSLRRAKVSFHFVAIHFHVINSSFLLSFKHFTIITVLRKRQISTGSCCVPTSINLLCLTVLLIVVVPFCWTARYTGIVTLRLHGTSNITVATRNIARMQLPFSALLPARYLQLQACACQSSPLVSVPI